MRWASFVAVGDSFTEGLDDPHEDGSGFRGWADLVAARLAEAHRAAAEAHRGAAEAHRGAAEAHRGAAEAVNPAPMVEAGPFRYANLAVRGRLLPAIVQAQVPQALRMRPDLISFAGGGNDVLRRHFDPHAMISRFDRVVGAMRAGGADVIVFRGADITSHLPGGRVIGPRIRVLNEAVTEVAHRHEARLVDLWRDGEFANPGLWSEDRLHLGAAGHRRVAAHVLDALGVPAEASWWDPPAPPRQRGWAAARAHDLRWARQYLVPWLTRRLTGRSSGDTVVAKRPSLAPLIN